MRRGEGSRGLVGLGTLVVRGGWTVRWLDGGGWVGWMVRVELGWMMGLMMKWMDDGY